MPRLNLTEEEHRHILQRRDNEKRYALGWNDAISALINLRLETGEDFNAFVRRANELRKVIR